MSGLVKAKEYDWKDTNLSLFGSDVEKNVNKWINGITVVVYCIVVFLCVFRSRKNQLLVKELGAQREKESGYKYGVLRTSR